MTCGQDSLVQRPTYTSVDRRSMIVRAFNNVFGFQMRVGFNDPIGAARFDVAAIPRLQCPGSLGRGSYAVHVSRRRRSVGRAELRFRSMAEISMLVTSIDLLTAYKVSDDRILELMSVTASVEDDSEGASVGTWWVQIVEPHETTAKSK
jgi:hypothetical protein